MAQDITQLGTTLKQLAGRKGAIRVTCSNEGFVVELFSSSDIADHAAPDMTHVFQWPTRRQNRNYWQLSRNSAVYRQRAD